MATDDEDYSTSPVSNTPVAGAGPPVAEAPIVAAAPAALDATSRALIAAGVPKADVDQTPAYVKALIRPEDIDAFRQQKYGTLGQMLKTGAEAALSGLSFGASKGLERLAGVNPVDILNREKVNPGTATVLGGLGMAAPLALSGPLGGAAELLGTVPRAIGEGASALTGLVGLGGEGAGLAGRLGAAAVKSGIEGALYSGSNEVGKLLLSDPDQNSQTALANIGLGAALGGGLGVATGTGGELWALGTGRKLTSALSAAHDVIENPDSVGTGSYSPIPESKYQIDALSEEAGAPGPQEVAQAADRLGVKPTTGTLSLLDNTKRREGSIGKSQSVAGVAIREEQKALSDGLEQNALATLRDRTDLSDASVGKQSRDLVSTQVKGEYEGLQKEYGELKPAFKDMPLDAELKAQASSKLLENPLVTVTPNSSLAKKANVIADEINGLKTAQDIQIYRTRINDQLSEAYAAKNYETAKILQEAKDALTGLRTETIKKFSPDTLAKLTDLDSRYANFKQGLLQFGKEGGFGKLTSTRDLVDRFSNIADEKIASRIFDPSDINSLNFMKQKFPDAFELARRAELSSIYKDSINYAQGKGGPHQGGSFDMGKFTRRVREYGPEAKDLLFGRANAERLNDIQTVYSASPGVFNPSDTGAYGSFAHFLTPAGMAENVSAGLSYALLKASPHLEEAAAISGAGSDAAKLAALRFASRTESGVSASSFQSMVNYIDQTMKGESALSQAVKGIFKSGEMTLPSVLNPASDKDKEKLDKKLKGLQANNSPLLNVGDQLGHYLPEHSQAMAKTTVNAVNYLNTLRPDTTPRAPLDRPPEPSKMAKAKFDQALSMAENPLQILPTIKKGMVNPEDLITLRTIYPALYERVSQKLYSSIVDLKARGEELPYKVRLGLSSFLGDPLDSTMTPQAMTLMRTSFAMPSGAESQGGETGGQIRQGGPSSSSGPHSFKALSKLASNSQTSLQARESARAAAGSS